MQDYEHRQEIGRAIISYFLGRLNRQRNGDVVFAQIGANDGVTEDFVYPWQAVAGWSGVVVEPVPYIFEKLVKNYTAYPQIKPIKALVGSERGEAPFYYFDQGSGVGEFIGSLDKEVVLRHGVFFEDIHRDLKIEMLPMVSFAELPAEAGLDRLDLVVTDTEGYDLKLLRSFNFERYTPEIYVLESKHSGMHDLLSANEFMAERGYQTVSAFEDTIYVGPQIVSAGGRDPFFQRVLAGAAALFG